MAVMVDHVCRIDRKQDKDDDANHFENPVSPRIRSHSAQWPLHRLLWLAERLSCGDGERKTPLKWSTATSRCHQRFVRRHLRVWKNASSPGDLVW